MGIDESAKLNIRNQPNMFLTDCDASLFAIIKLCASKELQQQHQWQNEEEKKMFEKLFTIIIDVNRMRQTRGIEALSAEEIKKIEEIITDLKDNESDFYLVQRNYHISQNESIVESIISVIRTISNYYPLGREDVDKEINAPMNALVSSELNKYVEICQLHKKIAELYSICLQGILTQEVTNLIWEVLKIKVEFNPKDFYDD